MKKGLLKLMTIAAFLGFAFYFSSCEKEVIKEVEKIVRDTVTIKDTVIINTKDTIIIKDTVIIRDTVYFGADGKNVSGVVKYPDANNVLVAAPGAVLGLSTASAPTVVIATAFTNATGNYSIPNLKPGNYFIAARFNSANVNLGKVINGITFESAPMAINLGTTDLTKDIDVATAVAPGALRVVLSTMDTVAGPYAGWRKGTFNTHSKLVWASGYRNGTGMQIQGSFNVFMLTKFAFDEANPANSAIDGYILTSTINTFEPARDALAGGCVRKTLRVDTVNATTALPSTDTVRFYTTSIVKYGDGYLAKGYLKGFYVHGPGVAGYAADTAGVPSMYWNTNIEKPASMFFNFEKQKYYSNATTWQYNLVWEGVLKFNIKSDYYINSSNIDNEVICNPHVMLTGPNFSEY